MAPSTAPSDDYEANEMPVEGAVLHRDKQVARTAFLAMLPGSLIFLLAGIAVAAGGNPGEPRILSLIPFSIFALFAWMMLTKTSIRSVLTTRELQVHWGLRKWKVPVGAITRCEAVGVLKSGLPMAQVGVNGWAPNGMVLVHWTDESGKEKKLQFPAQDPAAMVAQIAGARGGGVGAGVRVDAGEVSAGEEVEASASAGASEGAERRA